MCYPVPLIAFEGWTVRLRLLLFTVLFVPAALAGSGFRVHFWNLDATELALGGSVGAREGTGWVLAGNPAALPMEEKERKLDRILSFPNALRMTALLLRESGALPRDAIAAEEQWAATKEHAKWLAFSVLSLYRFVYRFPGLTVAFLPLREYPVKGEATVFSSTLAFSVGVLGLVRIGGSCSWYYGSGAPRYNPFLLPALDDWREWGFGGSVGIMLDFGLVRAGLEYTTRPAGLFRRLDERGMPVRDNSFSLACLWQAPRVELSLDLPTEQTHPGGLPPVRAGGVPAFSPHAGGGGALLAVFSLMLQEIPTSPTSGACRALEEFRFEAALAVSLGLRRTNRTRCCFPDFFM
jgi:hypothetical protein